MRIPKTTEAATVPAMSPPWRRHGVATGSAAERRRMVSCSMGMNTVVKARNWMVHSTVTTGANSVGPSDRPAISWNR